MYRVSVDVGGTFTDLVALGEAEDIINIKVPSVPKSPEKGVIDAFKIFFRKKSPLQVELISHATTIATNALFGQIDLELPKIALITTKGFRDIVEIGRQRRAEVYNLFFQRPPMLVSRNHRYEVEERIDSKGSILTPLNIRDVETSLDRIIAEKIESIAIGFINSYINPYHEEKVFQIAKQHLPDVPITTSSTMSAGYREYERFSTSIVNAVLVPIIRTYMSQLVKDLKFIGVSAPLYVMQSNGGMTTAEKVAEKPATIVESGPASGVIASSWLGEITGRNNIISFDMGGTTAKAGTVRGKVPEVVQEYEVAGKVHLGRLLKGSGYPVRFPFIDLAECSAGGGTIAWLDNAKALNVGPMSAGAEPGPACYGKGGKSPTITDANLTLGRLNPDKLLDGAMKLYPEKASNSIRSLAEDLGMEIRETASGILRIANSLMSKILRIVSVERGFDPRDFSLVAFGGAGPMHACPLAEELEINEILIPNNPGMFSALGLLTSDLFHDYSKALIGKIEDIDPNQVKSVFQDMKAEGIETLRSEGVKPADMSFRKQLDIRYIGQSYELSIKVPDEIEINWLKKAEKEFHIRHSEIYGYSAEEEPLELVNIRLRAIGTLPKPKLVKTQFKKGEALPETERQVYFEKLDNWLETPVYDRRKISPGFFIDGPAIIEQYDSTTVVYPSWNLYMDEMGILNLRNESS
jgi:N-methylhydantoinase A